MMHAQLHNLNFAIGVVFVTAHDSFDCNLLTLLNVDAFVDYAPCTLS